MDFDKNGRPLMHTPEDCLHLLQDQYDSYRKVATLSYSTIRKAEALVELKHSLSECRRATASCRAQGMGDLASAWRKISEFIDAQCYELTMWQSLNAGNYHGAWDSLIVAQGLAERAARWLPLFGPALALDEHLTLTEKVLFPRQVFISPSMIIAETDIECTICGCRDGVCDHIPGDVYDGVDAGRIIHKVSGIREISFVNNPANKAARALSYSGIDTLTGESPAERNARSSTEPSA